MPDEGKTELIVYNHFKKYEDVILIEVKKWDSPAIDKLFKNASKKGLGKTSLNLLSVIKTTLNY